MGPIYGTLIGTVAYVVIRLIGVFRVGFRFRVPRGIVHPEWKQMGWLIIPRMGALGALQLQLLLLDRLGSGLGNNMVAVNQFASNFESVIPGIVGIAIAQSAFSLLSQSAATGNFRRFKANIVTGMWFNLTIAIPGDGTQRSLALPVPYLVRFYLNWIRLRCATIKGCVHAGSNCR
jgi:peptidoglycan biosynthesis protein MviN/MurJ (putative lipid II flippase)